MPNSKNNEYNDFQQLHRFTKLTDKNLSEITNILINSFNLMAVLTEKFSLPEECDKKSLKDLDVVIDNLLINTMLSINSLIDELEKENCWVPHDILIFLQQFVEIKAARDNKEPSEYIKRLLLISFKENEFKHLSRKILEKCK